MNRKFHIVGILIIIIPLGFAFLRETYFTIEDRSSWNKISSSITMENVSSIVAKEIGNSTSSKIVSNKEAVIESFEKAKFERHNARAEFWEFNTGDYVLTITFNDGASNEFIYWGDGRFMVVSKGSTFTIKSQKLGKLMEQTLTIRFYNN